MSLLVIDASSSGVAGDMLIAAFLNFKNISNLNELGYTFTKTNDTSKYSFKNYNKFIEKDSDNFETIIDGVPVIVNIYKFR